eukprot:Stramenopile-MAST_4_protein_6490
MRLTLAVACVLLVFFALTAQLTAGDDGLSEGRSAHRRSSRRRFLLGSDEDDEDEDDDESEAGEVPRVYGVGTIVQRTLSLSTRFLDHVEVKDVSVAAVSVTFNDQIVLQQAGGLTADGDVMSIEAAMRKDFFPEAPVPSAFGVAELRCGTRRFPSHPTFKHTKDDLEGVPQGFFVPSANFLSYPKIGKLLRLVEQVAAGPENEQFFFFHSHPG